MGAECRLMNSSTDGLKFLSKSEGGPKRGEQTIRPGPLGTRAYWHSRFIRSMGLLKVKKPFLRERLEVEIQFPKASYYFLVCGMALFPTAFNLADDVP